MIPKYYEFHSPVKVLSGELAVDNIPYELAQMQAARPLIVTDPGVVAAGLLEVVVAGFSDGRAEIGAVYDRTPADSSMETVQEAAGMYRENQCDSLVAVGGGSVMDTAKGVNILVTEGGNDLLAFQGAERLTRPLKPLIAVPTTAGTGSEATLVTVVADPIRHVKTAFTSRHLTPHVAVLDPRMTRTMPPHITAATGMDALTHAVEAYTCLQKNPVSDAFAWAAIELIRDYLPAAVTDGKNAEARLAAANAALLAGVAFSNSMVGMVHSLAHAVGGVGRVPHGAANALLLPHVMEYNLDQVGALYGRLLLPLAGPEVFAATPEENRGPRAVRAVRDLTRRLHDDAGLPLTLSEAGLTRDQLAAVAEAAINDGSLTMNPKDMDRDDALAVLEKAFD
jgi:alcohol dehydrogenase